MRNTTLSRLALLGLASVFSIAFAANTVTGEIRFDARFTTSQKGAGDASVADSLEKPDNLFISRARLDMMGDVAKSWTYGIRLEQNEVENAQIGLDPSATAAQGTLPTINEVSVLGALDARIARAYVQWSGIEGINISMGRIGTPEISSDRLYYQPLIGSYPGNMSIGSMVHYSGDHAGFAVDGAAGPVGYSFGVWKQTDLRKLDSIGASTVVTSSTAVTGLSSFTSVFLANGAGTSITTSQFDTKSLRLGYGGRLSFANKMNANTSYGLAVGYNQAPLNMPIAVATMSSVYVSGSSTPAYSVATYNNLANFAVDGSVVFGAFQLNLGYETQKIKLDNNQAFGTAAAANTVFNYDGSGSSFWVEGGYLIMGDSYKFDDARAVISGVKLRENQAGLELVARWGTETRRNVLALVNAVGYSDFNTKTSVDPVTGLSTAIVNAQVVDLAPTDKYLLLCVDNTATPGTDGSQLVANDEKSYEEKASGWAVGLNYYLTENATIRAEFEQRSNEFNRIYSGSVDHDSLYSDSVSMLRLRADFSF